MRECGYCRKPTLGPEECSTCGAPNPGPDYTKVSASDIRDMTMAEYAEFRRKISWPETSGRGIFG